MTEQNYRVCTISESRELKRSPQINASLESFLFPGRFGLNKSAKVVHIECAGSGEQVEEEMTAEL